MTTRGGPGRGQHHNKTNRRDEMISYAVALKDGTGGTVTGEVMVGDIVTVTLHDENGVPVQVVGEVVAVLEEVAA